jgi:hypothetical protein
VDHAKHLDTDQALCKKDGMTPIDCNRIDPLQPWQWATIRRHKGAGSTHIGDSTARLYTAKHVSFCEMLML